jgi:hypothetical protein
VLGLASARRLAAAALCGHGSRWRLSASATP